MLVKLLNHPTSLSLTIPWGWWYLVTFQEGVWGQSLCVFRVLQDCCKLCVTNRDYYTSAYVSHRSPASQVSPIVLGLLVVLGVCVWLHIPIHKYIHIHKKHDPPTPTQNKVNSKPLVSAQNRFLLYLPTLWLKPESPGHLTASLNEPPKLWAALCGLCLARYLRVIKNITSL